MNNYSNPRKVGVAGFRGYSGAELIRILQHHSGVDLYLLEHRSDPEPRPRPLGQKPPQILAATPDAVTQEKLDVVFLATPAEVSLDLVPTLLRTGARVIDLSGAFRLREPQAYERWYGTTHTAVALLRDAIYGLPEFYRERIREASLVANPGCYPTAANLAIRPLIEAQIVDRARGIICDAKSGVSGAGRKASLKTSFCEVTENFSAYGFSDHRHVPEILQNSAIGEREFTFTAHLLPIDRGILETIYFRTERVNSAVELLAIYEDYYEGEPFIRLYPPGKTPDILGVQRTNFCDIGIIFDAESQRATVVAAEDNLGKGAAGQAVQNMNLMLGFNETEALL